jgi:hypothetical protein
MAVANGYGKVVTSGSVFMYDTGDFYNSYKGQPGTNITTGVGRNYDGYNRTTYETNIFLETNGYTEVVNIPALGPTTVQSIEINNSAPGQACCPNLYNYTGGWMSPIWLPGQTYSYQIIYKCRSGYTHPNFMYHYEYTTGESYLTEYGVFTTEKQESLGDGWYHAWNTFTTNASAAKGYTGLWYYNYYVADKLSIAAVSITPGDTIRPPQQIIPSGTTRSATQGLLPIVGNSTINLSNVSFTSNAQIVFDGTDDRIALTPSTYGITNQFTIEVVCYPTKQVNGMFNFVGPNGSDRGIMAHWPWSSDYGYFDITNTSGGFFRWYKENAGILNVKALYHFILKPDGQMVVKQNNQVMTPSGADTFTGNVSLGTTNTIGAFGSDGTTAWAGNIYVFKIYNRALTDAETTQNYNKYKSRFNLA